VVVRMPMPMPMPVMTSQSLSKLSSCKQLAELLAKLEPDYSRVGESCTRTEGSAAVKTETAARNPAG